MHCMHQVVIFAAAEYRKADGYSSSSSERAHSTHRDRFDSHMHIPAVRIRFRVSCILRGYIVIRT